MGKRNKNKKRQQPHQDGQKKRKVERYWVEDCVELEPPPTVKTALVVNVTRVQLLDDHTHGPHGRQIGKSDCEGQSISEHAATATTSQQPLENAAEAAPVNDETSSAGDFDCDKAFIKIQRAQSARVPVKQYPRQNFKPLPNGDCGDGVVNPHDKAEVPDKYWAQRKRLFSRFDDGIQLDKESWYSVTPEIIAHHIAARIVKAKREKMVVLDAFCGCGGNAISFAQRTEVSSVIAVDSDRGKLELTAKNASVYNIPADKLLLIHENACNVLGAYRSGKRVLLASTSKDNLSRRQKDERVCGYSLGGMDMLPECIDSIFLSPPWGGMDYEKSGKRNYHIESCIEVHGPADGVTWNGEKLLEESARASGGPVLFFLPRNVNGISLGRSALKAGYRTMEIEQNFLNDKLKTVTAYFGT
jgi:trimethylguanosine synthase